MENRIYLIMAHISNSVDDSIIVTPIEAWRDEDKAYARLEQMRDDNIMPFINYSLQFVKVRDEA